MRQSNQKLDTEYENKVIGVDYDITRHLATFDYLLASH